MEVFETIKKRRSIRKYINEPIEEEKLLKVLEAGRLSPSASNKQEWKFILIRDIDKRKLLLDAADGQKFVFDAPAVIVVCGLNPDKTMMCGQHSATIDCSIALTSMMLEAWELGLGTCWLGHFDANKVKKALNIPESACVVAMTPIGYPAESPAEKPRKVFKEVVSFDTF